MITQEELNEAGRAIRRMKRDFLNYQLDKARRGVCPERSNRMYVSDWVKRHYPKTRDAELVCKWFGFLNDGGQHYHHFILKGREQELLEAACQLEKEEKERLEKK